MRAVVTVVTVVFIGACSKPAASPAPSAAAVHRATLTATQDRALTVTAPAANDQAGFSVALSADGTLAVIGVPRDDFMPTQATVAGSVRVFGRVAGVWTETAAVRAPTPSTGAQFGFSVALSGAGDRLLVSAPFEDGTAGADVGAARVFLNVGGSWVLEATLSQPDLAAQDFFGGAVALSRDGTRAFVGAVGDEVAGGPSNSGSMRVFVRNASGWNFEALLTASDLATDDLFASSIATNADGTVVLIGARADDTDAGANVGTVRAFTRSGSTWTEEATLGAADAEATDLFGISVALSDDGLMALVGSSGDDTDAGVNAGSARPFLKLGGAWVEQPALFSPGPSFGFSVALRADGTRAVVGSPLALASEGAARVFTLETAGWTADTALTPTPAQPASAFGTSVALSANGDVMLVGMPLADAVGMDSGGAVLFSLVGLSTGFACTAASQCVTGSCIDGFCCDTACGGGGASCQGCSQAKTGLPNGTCGVMASGRVCRPSTGSCDPAEVCNGVSVVCPGNVLSAPGAICRSAAGPCDLSESCTGTSGACPADGVRPNGTECQPATGPCDDPDVCDGTSTFCRARFKPSGTVCNAAVVGSCDMPDVCTGASGNCPPAFLSGVECRPSVGACDLTEVCFGSAPDCPPDQVISGGIVCRASSNLMCDPMESCDGVSGSCPADVNVCMTGGGTAMPVPMMCPEAPACPAPAPEPARGCLQIGPGGPALHLFVLALLVSVFRRRVRSR